MYNWVVEAVADVLRKYGYEVCVDFAATTSSGYVYVEQEVDEEEWDGDEEWVGRFKCDPDWVKIRFSDHPTWRSVDVDIDDLGKRSFDARYVAREIARRLRDPTLLKPLEKVLREAEHKIETYEQIAETLLSEPFGTRADADTYDWFWIEQEVWENDASYEDIVSRYAESDFESTLESDYGDIEAFVYDEDFFETHMEYFQELLEYMLPHRRKYWRAELQKFIDEVERRRLDADLED